MISKVTPENKGVAFGGGVCIPYMPLNSYDDPSIPLMAYIGCHGSKRQLVSSESLMQVG